MWHSWHLIRLIQHTNTTNSILAPAHLYIHLCFHNDSTTVMQFVLTYSAYIHHLLRQQKIQNVTWPTFSTTKQTNTAIWSALCLKTIPDVLVLTRAISNFENPKWRRPPSWKVKKSWYLSRGSSDLYEIWHTDALITTCPGIDIALEGGFD